jgi:hypothetical protein
MVFIIFHQHHLGKDYLKDIRESIWIGEIGGECFRGDKLRRGMRGESLPLLEPEIN